MTAELNIIPLSKDQLEIFHSTLVKVKKNEETLYEIVLVAMIMAMKGYVDPSDYQIKIAIEGEKQSFINLVEEAIWLNKKQQSLKCH